MMSMILRLKGPKLRFILNWLNEEAPIIDAVFALSVFVDLNVWCNKSGSSNRPNGDLIGYCTILAKYLTQH